MQLDFVWTLLISLGITLIFELGFALAFKIRKRSELLLVAVVNIITNPAVVLLNYLALHRTQLPQIPVVIVFELTAVVVEGLYYKRYSEAIKKPFLFSLGANAFSYLMGLLINYIF